MQDEKAPNPQHLNNFRIIEINLMKTYQVSHELSDD